MAQRFVFVLVVEACGYENRAGYLAAASIHQVKPHGHRLDPLSSTIVAVTGFIIWKLFTGDYRFLCLSSVQSDHLAFVKQTTYRAHVACYSIWFSNQSCFAAEPSPRCRRIGAQPHSPGSRATPMVSRSRGMSSLAGGTRMASLCYSHGDLLSDGSKTLILSRFPSHPPPSFIHNANVPSISVDPHQNPDIHAPSDDRILSWLTRHLTTSPTMHNLIQLSRQVVMLHLL